VKLHGWTAGITVAAVAALFGAVPAPERADAACIQLVVWHDTAYTGWWNPADLPAFHTGRRLSGAVEPDCADTGGPAAAPAPVPAHAIDGVPSSVAIWAFGAPMIASGFFPQLSEFPIAPDGRRLDDETRGCRLGGALTVDGTAEVAFGNLSVVVSHSSRPLRLTDGRVLTDLFVDGHTRMSGLSRDGLPYIGDGQRVHVIARTCQVKGAVGPKIVARRVVAAGPIAPRPGVAVVLGQDWAGTAGGPVGATGRALIVIVGVAAAGAVAFVIRRRRDA
jgi:hypothetical protein